MVRHREPRQILCLALALLLLLGALPVSVFAASSAEIQKELDSLKAENKEIQRQIDGIQSQYDAAYSDMADAVAQKEAIDQEITLLNSKIETTNAQIAAYSQLIADTQDELDSADEALRALSYEHRERIRVMEEQGNLTYWQVIFLSLIHI